MHGDRGRHLDRVGRMAEVEQQESVPMSDKPREGKVWAYSGVTYCNLDLPDGDEIFFVEKSWAEAEIARQEKGRLIALQAMHDADDRETKLREKVARLKEKAEGLDMSAKYADSTMCDKTVEALASLKGT